MVRLQNVYKSIYIPHRKLMELARLYNEYMFKNTLNTQFHIYSTCRDKS
jgi:hypothetical protein